MTGRPLPPTPDPQTPYLVPVQRLDSVTPLSLDAATNLAPVPAVVVPPAAATPAATLGPAPGSTSTTTAPDVGSTESSTEKSKRKSKSSCFEPVARKRSPSPDEDDNSKMAEPPSKRAKRTDSSTMWERNNTKSRGDSQQGTGASERSRGGRDEGRKRHDRDDRRNRSRSPNKGDRRRERSRSRDRNAGRASTGGRDGGDRKVRERSTSRDRHRSRKGELLLWPYNCK